MCHADDYCPGRACIILMSNQQKNDRVSVSGQLPIEHFSDFWNFTNLIRGKLYPNIALIFHASDYGCLYFSPFIFLNLWTAPWPFVHFPIDPVVFLFPSLGAFLLLWRKALSVLWATNISLSFFSIFFFGFVSCVILKSILFLALRSWDRVRCASPLQGYPINQSPNRKQMVHLN